MQQSGNMCTQRLFIDYFLCSQNVCRLCPTLRFSCWSISWDNIHHQRVFYSLERSLFVAARKLLLPYLRIHRYRAMSGQRTSSLMYFSRENSSKMRRNHLISPSSRPGRSISTTGQHRTNHRNAPKFFSHPRWDWLHGVLIRDRLGQHLLRQVQSLSPSHWWSSHTSQALFRCASSLVSRDGHLPRWGVSSLGTRQRKPHGARGMKQHFLPVVTCMILNRTFIDTRFVWQIICPIPKARTHQSSLSYAK